MTEPESQLVPTGTYSYVFETTRLFDDEWHFSGTLTITSATQDEGTTRGDPKRLSSGGKGFR